MNNEPIRGDAPVPASPNTPQTPAPSGQPPAPDPAYPSYPVSRPAEPWQFSPPPTPRQPVPASSLDGGMTLLVFAAAWCFLHLCWPGYMGLGMFLFTLFFAGIAVGYRLWSGSPIPRGSYVWLGVMLLSAASFPILDNGLLSWLNLLFLMLITVYWVAVLGENRVEPRLGKRLLADLLNHLFIVPFQNFGCFGTVLARSTAKTRLGKNLLIGAVTLLCSFPVLWFVCQELSTVAAGFGELLEQFAEVISLQNILSATTLFAIPTAFYLYGLLYGNQHKRYTGGVTAEKLDEAAKKRRVLPPAAAYALLSVLCLIYALFFVIGACTTVPARCPNRVCRYAHLRHRATRLKKEHQLSFQVQFLRRRQAHIQHLPGPPPKPAPFRRHCSFPKTRENSRRQEPQLCWFPRCVPVF